MQWMVIIGLPLYWNIHNVSWCMYSVSFYVICVMSYDMCVCVHIILMICFYQYYNDIVILYRNSGLLFTMRPLMDMLTR